MHGSGPFDDNSVLDKVKLTSSILFCTCFWDSMVHFSLYFRLSSLIIFLFFLNLLSLIPFMILQIVPGYYLRRNTNGYIEHSACVNNTASEHFMVERLILDDLLCWAVDYKVIYCCTHFLLLSKKSPLQAKVTSMYAKIMLHLVFCVDCEW